VLDKDEVAAMMASLGYQTDEAYLENLMEVFASYDEDGSGLIEEGEFDQLYSHLVRATIVFFAPNFSLTVLDVYAPRGCCGSGMLARGDVLNCRTLLNMTRGVPRRARSAKRVPPPRSRRQIRPTPHLRSTTSGTMII
jgi:hypothetical protein